MELCSVDACESAARKGGLCWRHAKAQTRRKKQRHSSPSPRKPGLELRTLAEAALRYAEADSMSEEEYARAYDNLRKAAQGYAKPLLAVSRGRVGGLKRAASLSPERRAEIARKAAEKRWASDVDSSEVLGG